jgi:hypothetical protein
LLLVVDAGDDRQRLVVEIRRCGREIEQQQWDGVRGPPHEWQCHHLIGASRDLDEGAFDLEVDAAAGA